VADGAQRKARLSRSAEFDRVYRRGRSAQHRLLVLYRFERPEDVRGDVKDGACRLGVTVSNKVGGAVVRNKLKRQLRDALERSAMLQDGHDFVAIARPGLPEMVDKQGFDALTALVEELGAQLTPKAGTSK
jgi:ribonuclease P protein component